MPENARRTLDPATLEVLSHALAGIADEMGVLLIHGAFSPNIKERRDCSTALFRADGRLVAQAAHIPVHLGAMPDSVRAIMGLDPTPGDTFILNDPYRGGTHLPDITLVSPLAHEGRIVAYAASRAHHDDVGGSTPGSMPAGARSVYQEGIVIPPVRIVRGGETVEDVLSLILANVRTPRVRRADLRAQMAANAIAQTRLEELIERRGPHLVFSGMDELIAYAERRARAVIRELPDGVYEAEDYLEGDGVTEEDLTIRARVQIAGDSVQVDFEGTAPAGPGNFNCPLSVTKSAVYFVFQCLMGEDIPQNHGTYAPISLRVPHGCLINATAPSAVAAGNVETSRRIADVVTQALSGAIPSIPGQDEGTMNNVTIGGAEFTYYETIGGGAGASQERDGESGVHTGMTNTLNTPIEVLETELPVRVERYELRRDSGGEGEHRGGEGVVRSIRLLAPATVSIISDRRKYGPRGIHGGGDGAPGENRLNGDVLPSKVTRRVEEGDVLTIITPGGGGYGQPR